MACRIEYNNEGNPTRVLTKNGQDSNLFKNIINHPMIDSFEEALSIYKNTETEELYQTEDNYLFTNRADGEITSYKEALQSDAKEIELGFLDNSGNFTAIKTVQPNFDETTQKGFINSYIKQGILSENKITVDGISYYQPSGYTQAAQGINGMLTRETALVNLGWQNYQHSRNGFTFNKEQYEPGFNQTENILTEEINKVFKTSSVSRQNENTNKLNEDELKLRLLDLLNSLGVEALSISDYVAKYKIKNGVEPSAKALADIANKVVAFEGGEIGTEELAEEVAHFIVEGWSQEEIENLLRNIHQTPEWQQFSDEYRKIYAKRYQGEKLEQAVRREVLGKVLANSLKNNFQTENTEGIITRIINKLQQLFSDFINLVSGNTNTQYKEQLDTFTEQINDLLYENQLADFINQGNFENNDFVLYKTGSEGTTIKGLRAQAIQALKTVEQNIKKFTKSSSSNRADQASINRLVKQLEELIDKENMSAQKQAVIEMLAVADGQVNQLNTIIKETSQGDNFTFGAEENAMYQNLIHNLSPLIGSIKNNIQTSPQDYPKKDWKQTVEAIEATQKKITDLRDSSNAVYKGVINNMVDRIMVKHNLGEEYRSNVEAWLESAKSDTSLFHRHFGQITNSQDPLLGLASDVLERTYNGSNREYVQRIKQFQQRLRDLGVKEGDLKQLFNEGYLIDQIDHAAFERKLKEIRAEVRLEVLGNENPTKEEIDEVIKSGENNSLESLSVENQANFDKKIRLKMLEVQEKPFTEQYYLDEQEKYENLNISQDTINQRRSYSADRASLVQEAKREDGTLDYSKLSLASQERLEALKRKRQRDKALTNVDGTLKTGLSSTTDQSNIPQQVLDSKLAIEQNGVWYYLDPTKTQDSEARIAIDLIKLDKQYIADLEGENSVNEVPKRFIDEVAEIERTQGKDAALKFIETNSSIFFGQSFWENMSENGSYLDRIVDATEDLSPEDRAEVFKTVENIRNLNNRRSATIKQFRSANKPYETDASKMGSITKEALLKLDEDLQTAYQNLSALVTLEDNTEEESNPIYQNQVNEAYLGEVAEEQMTPKEEIEFILKNSTSPARGRIETFRVKLRRYMAGKENTLSGMQESFLENYQGTVTNETLDNVVRDYARTQLASYYKRLVPDEYIDVFTSREQESASDYLKNLIEAEYIEVQPNYSFLEQEDNKYANPNYNPNYEGGIQPKKGMFKSQKYEDTFGVGVDGQPTKNQNLYQALQEVKNLQRDSLKNTNLEGRHNLYKLPQMTKKGVDRVVDTVKRLGAGGVKGSLKELMSYRVDDIEYGESIAGTDINVIPTYYTRDIENPKELTDELFYSYATMYQQSVLHKHRKKNIGEMLAIKDALGKRGNVRGKDAEAKNTISMFKNYMDYGFFGKQETQEFKITVLGQQLDLTKFARNMLDFIKFRNLGFSPIVAATSWMTGEVNLQIEKHVKEILNPSAVRLGSREWRKLATDAMKEVGQLQSKSKLNTLGEFFGLYNLNERYESSNYGWFARNAKNAGWAVHQMANFPITPRAMLAVLHDNRVVDGTIVNFNDYKINRRTTEPNLTAKEIEADWKEYENEVIYNYIDVTEDGQVKFTEGLQSKLNDNLPSNYLETRMEGITVAVKRAAAQLDQQIPESQKVAAQRHFAMNYLMTHRSWFSIAIANRTKNSHYNLSSGEFEEGSYRSFYKFVQDSLTDFVKTKNIKAFSRAWNGEGLEKDGDVPFGRLLEVRRRNMRRVAVDSLWTMGVAAAAYALLNFSDDDEDNYALQMVSYLGLRTLNETVSSQTALPLQFYETLNAPFVGLGTLKDIVTLPYNVFDSEVVKSGRYKGMTGRERALTKILPGVKAGLDVYDVQNTKDTYWFYNKTNIISSPVILLEAAGLREND